MSFIKSKHSGWTWELKRTPFGGSGGNVGPSADDPNLPKQLANPISRALIMSNNPGLADSQAARTPVHKGSTNPVEAYAQQQQQAQQQQVQQQAQQQPVQQPTPVSPFVQQQRQQMMQQQMPQQMGIGQPMQQSGLQSMLARILGGGGGYGMPQQGMGMPPQGMPQQGYGMGMRPQGYGMQQSGMPSYGRFGGQQFNPLAYRPDMQAAMNNTGNVAVGVAEQQRRALQAQLDAANAQLAQQSAPSGGGGGGGGDSGGGA